MDLLNGTNVFGRAMDGLRIGKPFCTYNQGFQAALLSRIEDHSLLMVTPNNYIDLDNSAVWRQEKVKRKAVQLLTSIECGSLTNVPLIEGLRLLRTEGRLTSGKHGNLYMKLREFYSVGTANAQAAQVITLFKTMRVTLETAKSVSIPNPDSLVLPKALTLI